MISFERTTFFRAPIERVFDLARSIDLHEDTTRATGERAVAGVTRGLIGRDQTVTWRARHFGVWWRMTVEIREMERPHFFTDAQLRGPFRRMEHRHDFEETEAGTLMRDLFRFEAPLGPLGRLVERRWLGPHLERLLEERNRILQRMAETAEGDRYLPPAP